MFYCNRRCKFYFIVIFLFNCTLSITQGSELTFENLYTSLRPLSIKEMKKLIQRFPEILYGAVGSKTSDSTNRMEEIRNYENFLQDSLKLKEFRNPLLKYLFPKARFYQSRRLNKTQYYPYLITIVGDTLYDPIVGFNQLLINHKLTINDENVVNLSKAFVALSFGNASILDTELIVTKTDSTNFPKITFLIAERLFKSTELDVHIVMSKTKVDEKIHEWAFDVSPNVKGQFGRILIFISKDKIINIHYYPFRLEKTKYHIMQNSIIPIIQED
jgi:hypothetical protein